MWKTPYLSEEGEALSSIEITASDPLRRAAEKASGDCQSADSNLVWLAAYTTPRHEKAVARHLVARDVEYFLPLIKSVRRWKNGCNVAVESPVFPNYVFVRTTRLRSGIVREVPGVLAFAGSWKSAAAMSDSEIEWLRNELPLRKFEPHPYLVVGNKVRIKSGPLMGTSGILLRKKGGLRVVISVELIQQSVAVEVDAREIDPIRA
jgi:transcription antitermination factor NusG